MYDNFVRGRLENLAGALQDPRVRVFDVGGDIMQTDILEAALEGADGVFHLAALWLLQCHDFPRSAFDVNVGGTQLVLDRARGGDLTECFTRLDGSGADPELIALAKRLMEPSLDDRPRNAQAALDRSAQRYSKAVKAFKGGNAPQSLQELNAKLVQTERKLTNDGGLPRRPWFKHLIYAPGFYTGYGAKTLPGVREGIEEKRYAEAEKEITRVAQALQDYAAAIDAAAAELEKAGR